MVSLLSTETDRFEVADKLNLLNNSWPDLIYQLKNRTDFRLLIPLNTTAKPDYTEQYMHKKARKSVSKTYFNYATNLLRHNRLKIEVKIFQQEFSSVTFRLLHAREGQLCTDVRTKCGIKWNVNARLLLYDEY